MMHSRSFAECLLLICCFALTGLATQAAPPIPEGMPPLGTTETLCRNEKGTAFLTPEQGQKMLDYALALSPTREAWAARGEQIRTGILRGAGLLPLPRRTPLNPIIGERRIHDGYSVENVAIETIPGFYLTGNLYRPLKGKAPYPAILCPHGHALGKAPQNFDDHGRFAPYTQTRCAALARMGAVVFAYDMFAYGETLQQFPYAQTKLWANAHRSRMSLPMQIWDSMRALDFILSVTGTDAHRVGVTGESGGGTQTFLLTALDPRVDVAAPCVMVSSYFFGGCMCESGRPIHRDAEHFTTNAEIAALAAPRPMLVISDGKDWTQHVPRQEFPFLQKIYALVGAEGNVENAHFPEEGHDYGPNKRAAMYRFMAARLGLDLKAVQNEKGEIDESWFQPEPSATLRVFNSERPYPAGALKGLDAVEATLKSLQTPEMQ